MFQKIKQLEYENQDLHMQLQHNKAHYELQIQLIQDSCENRLNMMREDRDTYQRHFKEEKEILQNHIDLIEREKHELFSSYKKKSESKQDEFEYEMDRLKETHRQTLETIRTEHDDIVKRLKQMKDTEISSALSASTHTKTIEGVLNLLEDNTKNLDGLSQKVQMGHMMNLNEVEVQIRNKEQKLKSNVHL
jgi:Fas-binding factor 1